MPNLPSGSKIGLAFKCLGSVLLPIVKDEAGPAAEKGKELHAILEKFFKAGRKEEGITGEDLELCRRAARTIGPEPSIERSEFGMALDPSGRVSVWDHGYEQHPVLQPKLSGDHNLAVLDDSGNWDLVARGGSDGSGDAVVSGESVDRTNWFVAVADLVQWRGASSFAVFDWKSSGWVPDPKYNWQLLLPACWLYLAAGSPKDFECSTGIVYISKPDGDKFEHVQSVVSAIDAERLLGLLHGLRMHVLQASRNGRGTDVTLYEGKHCQYCPARHRCPAKIGALGSALLALSKEPSRLPDVELVRIAMALMDSKPQIESMAKNVLRSNGGEIDLGDGRTAVLTVDSRKRDKVYTRKTGAKKGTDRSDASEDGKRGTEGGGAEASEGMGEPWQD